MRTPLFGSAPTLTARNDQRNACEAGRAVAGPPRCSPRRLEEAGTAAAGGTIAADDSTRPGRRGRPPPVRGKRSAAVQVCEYPAAPERPVVGWFPDVREARCEALNIKLTRVRWPIGERSTVSSWWWADRDQRPGVCRAASAPIPTVALPDESWLAGQGDCVVRLGRAEELDCHFALGGTIPAGPAADGNNLRSAQCAVCELDEADGKQLSALES